jgi:hypothetical protein
MAVRFSTRPRARFAGSGAFAGRASAQRARDNVSLVAEELADAARVETSRSLSYTGLADYVRHERVKIAARKQKSR